MNPEFERALIACAAAGYDATVTFYCVNMPPHLRVMGFISYTRDNVKGAASDTHAYFKDSDQMYELLERIRRSGSH